VKVQHAVTVYSKEAGMTTHAKEEQTGTGIFTVIFSHNFEYIQFLNSFGIKMGNFVKGKKKISK